MCVGETTVPGLRCRFPPVGCGRHPDGPGRPGLAAPRAGTALPALTLPFPTPVGRRKV